MTPLPMTSKPTKPKDPIAALFKAKMRAMSVTAFRKYATDQGWTEDEAWSKTWTDERGRQWSTLSRLGYLMATSNDGFMKNQALLRAGLEHHIRHHGGGLTRQTEPGTPDLVWAYLGFHNVMANSSLQQTLERAFRSAPAPQPAWPSAGVGFPGDGGWVDTMLGLVETLVEEDKKPPGQWHKWFEHWHGASLLGTSGDRTLRWWSMGQSGKLLRMQGAVGRLPSAPDPQKSVIRDEGRPEALAIGDHFSQVWERTVRLATRCAGLYDKSFFLSFPTGSSVSKEGVELAPFLQPSAWEALADYIRVAQRPLLEKTKVEDYEVSTVLTALSLWVKGPHLGLSDQEQIQIRQRLTSVRSDHLGWNPELRAWVKSHALEKALESPVPSSPARPRF